MLHATGDTRLVVDLQRLAGNRAVTSVLERPAREPAATSPHGPVAVQRFLPGLGTLIDHAAEAMRHIGAMAAVDRLIGEGQRDEIALTDEAWKRIHPELAGVRLDPRKPDHVALIAEWRRLRSEQIRPRVQKAQRQPAPTTTTGQPATTPMTPAGPRPTLGTPAAPTADPGRAARLEELASSYEGNVATSTSIADQLANAGAMGRPVLEATLQALLAARLTILQTRLQLLEDEIAHQTDRAKTAPKKERPAIEKSVSALRSTRQQTKELIGPILRMTLRQKAARLDQQIAELDELLAQTPADPQTEARKASLQAERAALGSQMTATAKEYEQWTGPWAKKEYVREGSTIKSSGCGPTSLAMIINYMAQEDPQLLARGNYLEIVTPDETADYAAKVGARTKTSFGTIGGTMVSKVSTQWPGYAGREVSLDDAVAALRRGSLVLFNAKQWKYSADQTKGKEVTSTSQGHFMVLGGVSEDGKLFDILDPGSSKTGMKITYAELRRQANAGKKTWVVERK